MHQPIRVTRATFARLRMVAAASFALAATLFAGEARASTPASAWTWASSLAAAWARCDLRTDAQIEQLFERGFLMPLSSYDDDPTVNDAIVECLAMDDVAQLADGRRVLWSPEVALAEESHIYRFNVVTGSFERFAWNPWPIDATANTDGSFRFPDEPRFPLLETLRDENGTPIRRDGLLVFAPKDLHRGSNTVFEAAHGVKRAAEGWVGRALSWGEDGQLLIEPHAFWDLNAFYSPSARAVFFGIVGYRLAGETDVKVLESATSWEMAGHEFGHAVHDVLKPNADESDPGWSTWAESFADQIEMAVQLRDPGRVQALVAGPSLDQSNALSRMLEAWGTLVGDRPSSRDAVNDAKVSTTQDEVHARSAVLTGAVYSAVFVSSYDDLRRQGAREERALEQAGDVLGLFATHANDYMPENQMTLEDAAKGYLKVDAELFGGRYHDRLVAEFERRELFDAHSVDAWRAHEAAVPKLRLAYGLGTRAAAQLVRANLDRLGIGRDFGLVVQSVDRDERFRRSIVRVQLTQGRGPGAVPLDNHGVLVFRQNGTLAEWHAPLAFDAATDTQAVALLDHARRVRLDAHGAPLSIVRKANRALGVEARSLRGNGPSAWVEAYTLDAPAGARIPIPGCIGDRETVAAAGIVLGADAIGE